MKKLPRSAICYFVRNKQGKVEIMLGEKVTSPKATKRKIAGKLMSWGGDIESTDSSVVSGLCRELKEETGFVVKPSSIRLMARITVIDENGPRLVLYYGLARARRKKPAHECDIKNPRWFPAEPLPENILDADKIVLPIILDNIRIQGSITYNAEMKVVSVNITRTNIIK